MNKASQSIAPDSFPGASPQIDVPERLSGVRSHTEPLAYVRRGAGRASNEARAWLAVANVTPY